MANIFPNAGKAHVVKVLTGEVSLPADYYIHWGTGTGQSATSTTLATAASESRVAATSTSEQTTVADDTFRNVATLTCAGAGKTISEAALFTASTSGDMVVYGDFTGIPLNVADSITFTIDLKFA